MHPSSPKLLEKKKDGEREKDGGENDRSTAAAFSGNEDEQQHLGPSASTAKTESDKQTLILGELAATLNTIQNVSEVLDDILRLTDPSSRNKKGDNIVVKQGKLLSELEKWKVLLPVSNDYAKSENLAKPEEVSK